MKTKITILFCCILSIFFFNLQYNTSQREERLQAPPALTVKHFTFGYTETVGDSWWLTAIQNFTSCEQDRGGSSFSSNGARMGLNRTPSCSFSWLYYALNLVVELLPRFYFAAANGPIVLSVVLDDIDGASLLYDKILKLYPDDWVILSRAGTHFSSELEDRQKASLLFLRAARNGGPTWMALYASKLQSKEGQLGVARRILEEFRNNPRLTEDDKKFLNDKLKAIETKQ